MTLVILRKGSRGPDVEAWQRFLIARSLLNGPADGVFGDKTEAATVEFQRQNSLSTDGIVGRHTLLQAQRIGFVVYRRLRNDEVTKALAAEAVRIRDAHWQEPFGSEYHFEIDGKRYFGRIEQHYHPPGGPMKPWGYHHGVSLFIETTVGSDAVVHDPNDNG